MSRMLCEIHLTFHIDQADKVEALADEVGWKFSKIMNDPVLGDKPFCYLTTYTTDAHSALGMIAAAREHLEMRYSCKILREKIEVIIHDRKFIS